MAKSFDVHVMVLTGTPAWDTFTITNENLVIIQARTAVAIQVNFVSAKRGQFFTIKSGDQLPIAYRNGRDQTFSIRGAKGVVVEILRQFKN